MDVEVSGDNVRRVRVDMGEPILDAARIPTTLPGNPPVNARLTVGGREYGVTCVSMGNPHCVQFVEDVERAPVREIGPQIEMDVHFPQRTNVEFVQVLSRGEMKVRTWERGSGETMACGTGACAALVAANEAGLVPARAEVRFPGGSLIVDRTADEVFLTGPAERVFEATLDEAWLAARGL